MSSSYYASSSSFSQVNNEPPKTSQQVFSMNQNNSDDISGFYKKMENGNLVNEKSFDSLDGLKNILLEFQNNQHVLRNTYKQSLSNSPSLDGGYIRNIDYPYKKYGGMLKQKNNPIEKINPNEIITKQNYIKSFY